jgi:hypothetical protein
LNGSAEFWMFVTSSSSPLLPVVDVDSDN